MFVIGTAGHVDHGKSALVQALTGIDPDRLQEEKERGMTIDLGFAWLRLPSGREVSIVDVPGHERFIKNMLAGVGGIDLALLVVAADEGVMPQTREHLAILDLLEIKKGLVAITKKDLVDDDWLELVQAEVEELLKPTKLAGSSTTAVSSVTGEGLPDLMSHLEGLLDAIPRRVDLGRPRLPIDRVFSVAGFGTVVTGTLIDGSLSLGEEVEVVPGGLRTRIRGLQSHKQKVSQALPGNRVAANLAGPAKEELQRGQVLTTPGWLHPTQALDVKLRLLAETRPLAHNATVTLFTGADEVEAQVRLLEGDELAPGASTWAQLRLAREVAAVKGDFFVMRSPNATLGGGRILDAYPKRHRRLHAPTLNVLASLEEENPQEVVMGALATQEPCPWDQLLLRCHLPRPDVEAAVNHLVSQGRVIALGNADSPSLLLSREGWMRLKERVTQALQAYHTQFTLRMGMSREELKSRLRLPFGGAHFDAILERLIRDGMVAGEGKQVHLASFQVHLTPQQVAEAAAWQRTLEENPYSPPQTWPLDAELLNFLLEQGQVVKVADGVIFSAQAYKTMVQRIKEHIRERGRITVAEARDLFGTSRRYALALMEHLDQEKITRRIGDERVLR